MTTVIQPPSIAAAEYNIHLPTLNERYYCSPVRAYQFPICNYRIHITKAATLSIFINYVSYLALNLLICIPIWHPLAYISFPIGFLMLINIFCALRRKNHWFLLVYINFLIIYLIAIIIVIVFAIHTLQHQDDKSTLWCKTLIAVSAISFLLNTVCIYIVLQLYKLYRSFRPAVPSLRRLNRNIVHAVAASGRPPPSSAPICVISYPPPCPPAYEAEPSTSTNSSNSASHNPQRRMLHKPRRHNIPQVILPQYTDFRPDVYAEPPPYEEKPEVRDYI